MKFSDVCKPVFCCCIAFLICVFDAFNLFNSDKIVIINPFCFNLKINNGITIQFGVNRPSTVQATLTFPISFRYCQRFASTAAYDANVAAYIGLRYYGLSSVTTYASNSNALWYYWIAVGY